MEFWRHWRQKKKPSGRKNGTNVGNDVPTKKCGGSR